MTTTKQFNNICSYQGSNFKEWFGSMPFKKGENIPTFKKLEKWMTDKKIIDTWHPKEVSLGDIYATLEKLDHSIWAIFYCKDISGVLRAVRAFWHSDGWCLSADPVEYPDEWNTGIQVFSREFSDTPKTSDSDPVTLRYSDLPNVESIDARVTAIEQTLSKIKEIL